MIFYILLTKDQAASLLYVRGKQGIASCVQARNLHTCDYFLRLNMPHLCERIEHLRQGPKSALCVSRSACAKDRRAICHV